MKNMFRGMALLFLPFGGLVPSGVALLWVSNSFFSVLVSKIARTIPWSLMACPHEQLPLQANSIPPPSHMWYNVDKDHSECAAACNP